MRQPGWDFVKLVLSLWNSMSSADRPRPRHRQPAPESHTPSPDEQKAPEESDEPSDDVAVSARRRRLTARVIGVMLVALGIYVFDQPEPPPDADRLVIRAIRAEHAHVLPRIGRVLVRFTPEGPGQQIAFTQDFGLSGSAGRAAAMLPASILQRLEPYQFSWEHPLSAGTFVAWRSLHAYRDDHIARNQPDGSFTLHTATGDSELREAEITLDAKTDLIVHEAFVLPGVGRLEVGEMPEFLASSGSLSLFGMTPALSYSRGTNDPLELTELETRLAIANAAIDLHGDVRVFQSTGAVHLDGVVPQEALKNATGVPLAPLPRVKMRLRPESTGSATEDIARATNANLARWANPAFDSKENQEAFIPALTQQLATVERRLKILHELAARYPKPEVPRMSPQARQTLEDLVQLHYEALNNEMQRLDAQMTKISGAPSRTRPPLRTTHEWRTRTAVGLRQATALDHLVRRALRPSDRSPTPLQLDETLGSLWDALSR